jgi:hypothetical protein
MSWVIGDQGVLETCTETFVAQIEAIIVDTLEEKISSPSLTKFSPTLLVRNILSGLFRYFLNASSNSIGIPIC